MLAAEGARRRRGIGIGAQRIVMLHDQGFDRIGCAIGDGAPQTRFVGSRYPAHGVTLTVPGAGDSLIDLVIAGTDKREALGAQTSGALCRRQPVGVQHHALTRTSRAAPARPWPPVRPRLPVMAMRLAIARGLHGGSTALTQAVPGIDDRRAVTGEQLGDFLEIGDSEATSGRRPCQRAALETDRDGVLDDDRGFLVETADGLRPALEAALIVEGAPALVEIRSSASAV